MRSPNLLPSPASLWPLLHLYSICQLHKNTCRFKDVLWSSYTQFLPWPLHTFVLLPSLLQLEGWTCWVMALITVIIIIWWFVSCIGLEESSEQSLYLNYICVLSAQPGACQYEELSRYLLVQTGFLSGASWLSRNLGGCSSSERWG